jgi:hypothetical protein
METLKIFGMIIFIGVVYSLTGNDDYHKRFDKLTVVRYDCDMLIGGWHPDVPREVIEQCRLNPEERYVNVKTYKE